VLDGIGTLLVGAALPTAVAFAIRAARPAIELVLDPGILAARRRRKRPDELEHLRAAGRHADDAAEWIAAQPLAGRTERDLALALTVRFLESGADPYDHYIVATGAHGALPHHATGDTPTLGRPRKRLTDAERNELTERDALIGRPDEIIRRIKRLQEGGVEYVMVIDFAGSLDHLRTFAREVMPAFA